MSQVGEALTPNLKSAVQQEPPPENPIVRCPFCGQGSLVFCAGGERLFHKPQAHSGLIMNARQKSYANNHEGQNALTAGDSSAAFWSGRRIQTALFLVLRGSRQHVGSHERQAIDALVCQESSFVLLQALDLNSFLQ